MTESTQTEATSYSPQETAQAGTPSASLDIGMPQQQPIVLLTPKITVIGVGGAGGNAINNMIQSNLEGVSFVVANTDAQALNFSMAEKKIQLGLETTKGQGAGARPEIGRESAEESIDQIAESIEGANMVFITAGMGGGTGTGAAPVFARLARERDILTVGVVTKPFTFEGRHRMAMAEKGIEELAQYVDTLIVIPNQNLFLVADEKMTFADAFKRADQVLQGGVRSITDLIITPGIINLDFSDVRTVMTEMGRAMMGTGVASGENRALEAAEEAIANPLLDDASMTGARGILINIAGGTDLTLYEVDEAANRIRREVDPEANIIFGASFDPSLEGSVRVSVVATGISRPQEAANPFSQSAVFPVTSTPSFTSAFAKQPASAPAAFKIPDPVAEPVQEETEAEMTIEPESEEIAPAVSVQPQPQPKTSSSLPAMPSAKELFQTGGEASVPVPTFDAFTPKPAMTAPSFRRPAITPQPAGQPLFQTQPQPQQPQTVQPVQQPAQPDFPAAPRRAETEQPAAPKVQAPQQDELFSGLQPPSIPPAVKPVEKEKPRPSLFQFVTGRRAAAQQQAAEEKHDEYREEPKLPSEEELDIPAFLRQR